MPTTAPPPGADTTEERWYVERAYASRPARDVAGDPATPLSYLRDMHVADAATFIALVTRPEATTARADQLRRQILQWPFALSEYGPALAAALTHLPDLTAADLLELARQLNVLTDSAAALTALATHPACTDEALAWALTTTAHTAPDRAAVAATGSLVPWAQQLVVRADRHWALSYDGWVAEILKQVGQLTELFPDPQLRALAAQVGLSFPGTVPELSASLTAAAA